MITLCVDKEVYKTVLDALEIAISWHKHETRFKKALKAISKSEVSPEA